MVVIYDIKTGKEIKLYPVDAKEWVATGNYSFDKPAKKKPQPTEEK